MAEGTSPPFGNFTLVCPRCGDAWARVESPLGKPDTLGRDGTSPWRSFCSDFFPLLQPCPECPKWYGLIPGSLLDALLKRTWGIPLHSILPLLPDDLLRWEYLIHSREAAAIR
jgi:hypothetical protein